MASKKIWFDMPYDSVQGWYIVDNFNRKLTVGVGIRKNGVFKSMPDLYLQEARGAAYDHYNINNKENEFIYSDSADTDYDY